MKTDGMTEDEINTRHAEKMAKKKAARDKIIATKTIEKGLLIVHTGKGASNLRYFFTTHLLQSL